ncbi:MAG: ATP-binding cassette domain-containing protein [bacterium]
MYAVETERLSRKFREAKKPFRKKRRGGEIEALSRVTLRVRSGELFGLLGPNGAGKTTLVKILTTLLLPTSGEAKVCGLNVIREANAIRSRINMVSGGEYSGYGILTVRETLWMYSQFYGVTYREARRRIDKLLSVVGLSKEANTKVHKLSTGMRQKMNFARGFISDPEVVFLDEPTLGLDVTAARDCRHFIREWLDEEPVRTVLLTTHYMAEADELCQRLAIIDKGQILACGSPSSLKEKVQKGSVFLLEVRSDLRNGALNHELSKIGGVSGVNLRHDAATGLTRYRLQLEEDACITDVLNSLSGNRQGVVSLRKSEPTLEDAFVQVVGHGLCNGEENLLPPDA